MDKSTVMSEVKDPAIKLFGKTIQLLHLDAKPNELQQSCSRDIKRTLGEKEHATSQTQDTYSNQSTSSGMNDDPKTPTADKETSSTKKEKEKENPNSEEKPQKPDKILPCPRCNSMDTKFCYYNNYNVNQPRHFCKHCQRYWTDGGTMRNTPVGSGRRKNKTSSSASYYRHLIISEALNPSLKTSGSVLNFGSDVPLCESMNSALNFSDKPQRSEDDHSSCASNSVENGGNNGLNNFQKYPLQITCFPAPTWAYNPWNAAPPMNLGHSGIPVNFYPTPQYWGCSVQVQPPNTWSMPLVTSSSPLGKHSRDGNLLSSSLNPGNEEFLKDEDSESGTLRNNNPNETAKSQFWSTLGVSKDEHGNNSTNGGKLHKVFQSVSDHEKNEFAATSLVNLQANPAALSRSLSFQETS